MQGPPGVRAEASQWGKTGDTVAVDCFVSSASPRSVTVTWSKYGSKVDLGGLNAVFVHKNNIFEHIDVQRNT